MSQKNTAPLGLFNIKNFSLPGYFKNKYMLFLVVLVVTIVAILIVLEYNIGLQSSDARLINRAGRQRMLSQRIVKLALFLQYHQNENKTSAIYTPDSLRKLTDEWERSHHYLYETNLKQGNNKVIDSLLRYNKPYLDKIVAACRQILKKPEPAIIKQSIDSIAKAELPFLMNMEVIVKAYQKEAESKLHNLKILIIWLALLAISMFIGEFVLIVLPVLKQLKEKNHELAELNAELVATEEEVRSSLEQTTLLKADLEIMNERNMIFVQQSPNAIAMFDTEMRYMAASSKWLKDYQLTGKEIIGHSHYEIFPEIGNDWKTIHRECLQGAINQCDEARFERADGSIQWITWDVRPWYIGEGNIGGLLMYTADITHIKEKDLEKRSILEILDKTSEVARIGTWEVDIISGRITWSRVTREIHEVEQGYELDLASAILFYKKGESRDKVHKVVSEAITHGTPYDIELELITAKGNTVWIRAIGQAEFVKGKCKRLYGVFQDIDKIKKAEKALNKVNEELNAIFNSGPIVIIGTDKEGIITHFNRGAETLLQYSAGEMIGKNTPVLIHVQEEVEKRGKELSATHGRDISGFDVFAKMASLGKYNSRKWTYVRKDGSTFPVQLIVTTLKDESGEITGFLGMAADISESVENKKKLMAAKQNLELLTDKLTYQNTQLANFAHITSHNLRSPVGNLNALLNLYKISEKEDEKGILFAKFETVIEHLSSTLENLVETLKIKEGSNKQLEMIRFEDILIKIKEIISEQIIETGTQITGDFSGVAEIEYDRNYMESIFLNLLTNGIKYRSPDRVPEIVFQTENSNGRIKLTVSDNGLGINMTKHGSKLFGLHKTFHGHAEAKGVGLYITKTQIESMGGSISASSEVGKGTVFTIYFN